MLWSLIEDEDIYARTESLHWHFYKGLKRFEIFQWGIHTGIILLYTVPDDESRSDHQDSVQMSPTTFLSVRPTIDVVTRPSILPKILVCPAKATCYQLRWTDGIHQTSFDLHQRSNRLPILWRLSTMPFPSVASEVRLGILSSTNTWTSVHKSTIACMPKARTLFKHGGRHVTP